MARGGEEAGITPAVGRIPLIAIDDVPQMYWDAWSDLLLVAGADGVLVATNPAWRRAMGWSVAQHPRIRLLDLIHENDREGVESVLRSLAVGHTVEGLSARLRTADGDHRDIVWSGFTDGSFWYFDGHDVTDDLRRDEAHRAQAQMLDSFEVAIVNVDADLLVVGWNAGAERLYGWTRAEAMGQPVADLIAPRPVSVLDGEGSVSEGRFESTNRHGETRVAQVRWTELTDSDGQFAGTLSVGMDVTAQVQAENQERAVRNRLEAVTDAMTEGMYVLTPDGRVEWMNQRVETLLGWSLAEVRGRRLHDVTWHQRSGLPAAEAGHEPDECPIGAPRDADVAEPVVLRVEGEEFRHRSGESFPVSYTVTSLATADESTGTTTGGWVVVFRDATDQRAEQERLNRQLQTLRWSQRIEHALAEQQLELHAQPIVDLRTHEVVQRELLLRIVEPDGTIAPPCEFLEAAQEHGLIGRIDRWVLRRAVDLAAAGHAVEPNISATSLSDRELLDDFARWLSESGADPALLVLEITETAVNSDEHAVLSFVELIHSLGCKVALDDFGTGYSGFAYLKQMPVDFVKIDIEYVRDLSASAASRHVVEAVVTMAAGMGMRTIAEGVEDAETLSLLTELGVDLAQGHHLGRPAPLDPASSAGTAGPDR